MKMISLTSPMSSENVRVRARFDGPFPMRLCVKFFVPSFLFSFLSLCFLMVSRVCVNTSTVYK